jgi:hypothetical protein
MITTFFCLHVTRFLVIPLLPHWRSLWFLVPYFLSFSIKMPYCAFSKASCLSIFVLIF